VFSLQGKGRNMPLLSKKTHKASKAYSCMFCHKIIQKDEQYHRLFGIDDFDGKPCELLMCDCCDISKIDENKK